MSKNSWLEVDREGLRQLQEGKPKHFIIKELAQNAWDENTTICEVRTSHQKGIAEITVIDDNPEGFRERCLYTLRENL